MTAPSSNASKRILVIDDDEGIREGLATLLMDEGYDVAIAENGKHALGLLGSTPLPSLILLDLMMPVMDGFEFCDARAANPGLAGIPVIVLTAGAITDQVRGMTVTDRLRKPIEIDALLDIVKRHA